MKKLYIIGPIGGGDGVYSLVADDGEGLASHYCSNAGFAMGDLLKNRPERKEKWKEKYGDYQVLFAGDDELTEEELLARNKTWFESLPPEQK